MALKQRKNTVLSDLIFHSDGGGQYYCKKFIKVLKSNEIKSSMAENIYENATAERLNGIIKNDYLYPYNPQTFEELKQMLIKSVKLYNYERPHMSIGSMAPVTFETIDSELLTKIKVINKRKKFDKKEKLQHHNDIINNFALTNENIIKTVNPI